MNEFVSTINYAVSWAVHNPIEALLYAALGIFILRVAWRL
jgi:hypothetical protein